MTEAQATIDGVSGTPLLEQVVQCDYAFVVSLLCPFLPWQSLMTFKTEGAKLIYAHHRLRCGIG